MNWVGITIAVSLVALAIYTAPAGLVLLLGLIWLWRRS